VIFSCRSWSRWQILLRCRTANSQRTKNERYYGRYVDFICEDKVLLLITILVSKKIYFSIPVIEGVKWEPTAYDKLTYLNIRSFSPEEIELLTVDELTPREFWRSLKFAENENLFSVKDEL
jgi:hypothetical protein